MDGPAGPAAPLGDGRKSTITPVLPVGATVIEVRRTNGRRAAKPVALTGVTGSESRRAVRRSQRIPARVDIPHAWASRCERRQNVKRAEGVRCAAGCHSTWLRCASPRHSSAGSRSDDPVRSTRRNGPGCNWAKLVRRACDPIRVAGNRGRDKAPQVRLGTRAYSRFRGRRSQPHFHCLRSRPPRNAVQRFGFQSRHNRRSWPALDVPPSARLTMSRQGSAAARSCKAVCGIR